MLCYAIQDMICYGNLFLPIPIFLSKFSFSTEWMNYQLDSLLEINNNTWNVFQKRYMHFIHLNVNSLLSKIDEICYFAKLTNATVVGLSETKLDNTVLSSELEIEGYNLARFDQC